MDEEYLLKAVRRSADKISKSSIFVGICTQKYLDDPYCAMQLGLAVLMDKPIRLLVPAGCDLPKNLLKIAEKIEYYPNPDDLGLAADRLLSDLKEPPK